MSDSGLGFVSQVGATPPPPPPLTPPHPFQASLLADKRIVVAIDSWEADSGYPAGHYVRTLGQIGDKETETEVGGCWGVGGRIQRHAP